MPRLNASQARTDFSETLNRVAYQGERVVLHRRGKPLAALISLEDLDLLEAMEDRLDIQEAERILQEARKKREEPVSWEKVRKALRL